MKIKDIIEEPERLSRKDWRKVKKLENERKSGDFPPVVDKDGRDIDPHLPHYISSAAWCFDVKTATLKHEEPLPKKQEQFRKISEDYVQGLKGKVCSRYGDGACEDCFKSPSKIGAKYSQKTLEPDEILRTLALNCDSKLDKWNGQDSIDYQAMIKMLAKVKEVKQLLKKANHVVKDKKLVQGDYMSGNTNKYRENTADIDGVDNKEIYANMCVPGTKVDSEQRITLGVREDPPKYIKNLGFNSAYYNPESQAMRGNPLLCRGIHSEELNFGGNFARYTGDVSKCRDVNSWQGTTVNLLPEPKKTKLLHQEFMVKKEVNENFKDSRKERYSSIFKRLAERKRISEMKRTDI